MKLIKKINNNFALAEDSGGNQVIVEGRGVGFNKMPCTITDLSCISHTYYDYDEKYLSLSHIQLLHILVGTSVEGHNIEAIGYLCPSYVFQ